MANDGENVMGFVWFIRRGWGGRDSPKSRFGVNPRCVIAVESWCDEAYRNLGFEKEEGVLSSLTIEGFKNEIIVEGSVDEIWAKLEEGARREEEEHSERALEGKIEELHAECRKYREALNRIVQGPWIDTKKVAKEALRIGGEMGRISHRATESTEVAKWEEDHAETRRRREFIHIGDTRINLNEVAAYYSSTGRVDPHVLIHWKSGGKAEFSSDAASIRKALDNALLGEGSENKTNNLLK